MNSDTWVKFRKLKKKIGVRTEKQAASQIVSCFQVIDDFTILERKKPKLRTEI